MGATAHSRRSQRSELLLRYIQICHVDSRKKPRFFGMSDMLLRFAYCSPIMAMSSTTPYDTQ